jgi:subtilisin family serine protease
LLAVPSAGVLAAVNRLRREPGVAYAEPDYLMSADATPNDPSFSLQWGDQNSGQAIPFQKVNEELGAPANGTVGADDRALAAWGVSTGSRSIVIGETDTGIDYNHPDLHANIWSNPGGIGGCAAVTHGYNVVSGTCDPMDDDTQYDGHGTHVAGIMGAVGNNGVGVAGMNWQTSILPVKWLSSQAMGSTSGLISALQWLVAAKQAGVNLRVVNDSATFVGTARSQALSEEIDTLGANNILFVTAAGNSGNNNDEEAVRRYPCGYDRPSEICVTVTNNNDQLPSWANYGPHTVNLAAPGVSIFSTLRNGSYGYLSGGSMASPQVAGAAALILSAKPSLSTTELRADILENVDKLPTLEGKVTTGGRLDVCKAMPGCSTSGQPTAVTEDAASITQTSATLNATVNPNGRTVSDCHFDYGPSESYGSSAPCSSLPGSSASPVAVSASVAGLGANTTYHFRIVASNAGGSSHGDDETLITQPDPPTVATSAASSISQTSATLNGAVNPNGATVTDCHFDYGTSQSYGSSLPCASLPGSGESPVAVSVAVGALSANTTYHFRIVATSSGGTEYGGDQTVSTLPGPPTVTTNAASSITQASATLNGTVNPDGATVEDCHFEYGTSLSYGSSVPCASPPGSGNSAVAESAPVASLTPLTSYYVRIVASNPGGTSYGGAQTFTTQSFSQEEPLSPSVLTGVASALTQTSATLNASVNPDGWQAEDCHFEYGTSLSYGSRVPCESLPGSGNSAVQVSAPAEGLTAGTSYDFRVVATNAGGTSYGAAQGFTTLLVTAALVSQGPGGQLSPSGQGVLAGQKHSVTRASYAALASTALVATSSGAVKVKVICRADERRCADTVTLSTFETVSVTAAGHQHPKPRTEILTIARGSFTVVGGCVTTVTLRLSAKARALLAHTNTLRARATIFARDSTGATHTNEVAVTLRLAAAARRGSRG